MLKSKDRNKLKIFIVGFFVLFIPIFIICHQLYLLYSSTKEDIQQDLREKLLSVSSKIKNDLDIYNYLYSETSKIHATLFPDLPEEITDKILDDSYAQNLYTKETFDKLITLIKENFSPIFISFGTNNLKKYYSYYSPEFEKTIEIESVKELAKESAKKLANNNDKELAKELEKKIEKELEQNLNKDLALKFRKKIEKEKNNFLISKASFDAEYLTNHFKICFKSDMYDNFPIKSNEDIIYKYLSRFKYYQYSTKIYYTDYFEKQLLFNVSKYTFSKKGIHGYYSLVIPQKQINPESMVYSVIGKNSSNEIKIDLIPNDNAIDLNGDLMLETEEGFEYFIDLPTEFKNHIKTYYKLRNEKDKSNLSNKIFKLSIKYPQKLYNLLTIFSLTILFTIILVLLYIIWSINIYVIKFKINISLTRKLILVLSAIVILPIFGIGLLTWVSTQKFTRLIDYNVTQNLNNEIDNIYIINKENNQRQLSEIFEIKHKLEKNCFSDKKRRISDEILSEKETDTWYKTWTSNLVAISQDGSFHNYNFRGKKFEDRKKENSYGILLPKYANNLSILNNKINEDIKSSFTLGSLENYINLSLEEQSAGQESIPHRLLLGFNQTNSAVYFYAQDCKKQHNLLINVIVANYFRYKYIGNLRIPKHQNWFETQNDYFDINLGIAIDYYKVESKRTYPFLINSYNKVSDIINKSLLSKDSYSEKAQSPDGNIVRKSIYTDNDPFIIGGVAKSNYNNLFSFGIYLIFPILLTYALFLMFLLTDFISVFIKEPVEIYKEAIDSLENKEYGVTINSFSKDEFESITTAFNEMSLAVKQKFMISRYVSDKLIQSVNQNNLQEAGDSKQEKVTILSSDIRNFTGTSEKYEPSVIVEMLNSYFTKMQQAISDNGGIIDKYIGDAIQAVFYDEPDRENQVIRASKAAIAMRKALEEFNKEREKAGLFTIQNGIGIDTDFAITGTIGTEKGRKDFSVNGDVIARAAELEAKTKMTESKILISKKSLEELDCHVANAPRNDGLVYKDFDSESEELIDVR